MITTIVGTNSYSIKKFLQDFKKSFIDDFGDMAVEQIDCEDVEYTKILDAVQSLPFLVPSKLVILLSPSSNKKFTEVFADIADSVPDNVKVFIVESKLDKRSVFYKTLKSKTEYKEFNELDLPALTQWVVSEVDQKDGKIARVDAKYLVERVGLNQTKLGNELDKLLTYKTEINRDSIDNLTTKSIQSSIFDLIENTIKGNTKVALEIYEEQRQVGVEPQQIIAMLAWQLQALAIVKTAGDRTNQEISTQAKMNPYVVSKTQNLAKNMTYKDIKQNIGELYKLDISSKSTSIDVDQALQGYIMGL